MNDSNRDALAGLLMQFHISTKAARGTREELACLNTTIDEIDRLLTTRAAPTVDDDAVERAAKALWNKEGRI